LKGKNDMPKTVIIYDSVGNNVKQMADVLFSEFEKQGATCERVFVDDFPVHTLVEYEGIFIGTPNYFGGMTNKIKKLFDTSVRFYKQLDGKLGACFCSTGVIGGGGETAIMAVIRAMLVHGMIVQGCPETGHYGVLAIGKPDARVERELKIWARRFISLLVKIVREP
jgi:NAD(P)H dehydrogenase (quinone)